VKRVRCSDPCDRGEIEEDRTMLSFKKQSRFVALFLFTLVFIIGSGTGCRPQKQAGPPEKITIAYSTTFMAFFVYIAHVNDYFRQEGLEAEMQPHTFGKLALQAVIEGKADVATAADTPVMLAIMNGESINILATIGTSNRNTAIIARKDRGIAVPSDLKRKIIAVALGTTSDFFADNFLKANGIEKKEVKIIDMTPDKMVAALNVGKIDAASLWNPPLRQLQNELGDKGLTFYGEMYFSETFCIAAKADFVEKHPEATKKVLRAIIKAEAFVLEHPEDARRLAAEFIKLDRSILDQIWDIYNFRVTLDQALIIDLEDQTRWAIKNRLVARHVMPNYLDFIYMDGLQAVKPEAVRIIR
jgi:ABC-type nitrate/sulfonate/bicarbonate transport system substrate-binding protein